VGFLIFVAHLFAALFEKTRLPEALPLVGLGLLIGPVLGLASPDSFGQVGPVFTTLTLVILLFESGLGLNFSTLREALPNALKLTGITYVATTAAVTSISMFMFKMTFLEALLLGTILAGTSPATIIPLLQKQRIHESFRASLLLEPTLGDVLCIVLTLELLPLFKSGQIDGGSVLGSIISSFFLALIMGAGFGFLWSQLLVKVRLLENTVFSTPAFVSIVYGLTEFLGYSGPIAVLAFGIVLGNMQGLSAFIQQHMHRFVSPVSLNRRETDFLGNFVFLLKTFFFVYIGLSVKVTYLSLLLAAFVLVMWICFIRIPAVMLAVDKSVARFDISIASAMVARGLAAAALASLPSRAGIGSGLVIKEVVFDAVVISIVFTAILTFLIDKGYLAPIYNFVFSRYPDVPLTGNTEVEAPDAVLPLS
jgi:potassium/hydrogen antiporter